jgi:adenosine 3'-phospho 5'-phosphosulfate transporter B2
VWYGGRNNLSSAPIDTFCFPSIANTVSSFAAYESLRFMSFPMSTVCKTLKIIPTMFVGTLVHRKVYSSREYASASVITLGAALFAAEFGAGGLEKLLSSTGSMDAFASLPGLVLMTVYLGVDAFTSNLQTLLFQEYLLTPYECMLGINLFSIVLTVLNLINAGEMSASMTFLARNPSALVDVSILALSSALGQLFIYYTIERHGPIVFTVIQLTRQLLAILLSSWSFGHVVNAKAWIGLLMLFSGIFAMNSASSKGKVSGGKAKKDS